MMRIVAVRQLQKLCGVPATSCSVATCIVIDMASKLGKGEAGWEGVKGTRVGGTAEVQVQLAYREML